MFLPNEKPAKPFRTNLNAGEVFWTQRQSSQLRNKQTLINPSQHLPQFGQFNSFSQKQELPREYGAPPQTFGAPPSQTYPYPPAVAPFSPSPVTPSVHEVIDETLFDDNDAEIDITDPTVIAVANANGRYYILGKDNTLKRVAYQTSQDEDDKRNNGFTAHLRYTLVEPIQDPIYGYDDKGHLVRIYNKK